MSQIIISYILSKLANIADVQPADIQTSLQDRSIALKNVSLRKDAMNAILPVHVEDFTILNLAVFLPRFTTSEPIRVEVEQACLVAQMSLSEPSPERTLEKILSNITNETILGCPKADLSSETANKALPEDEELLYTESEVVEKSTVAYSENAGDYGDLLSCRSDSEFSDAESTSLLQSEREGIADTNRSIGGGFFSYLRDRALDSIKWIWQRPIQIIVKDLTFVLKFDLCRNLGFDCHVDYLECVVELKQGTDPQQLSLVNMSTSNVDFMVTTDETSIKVISIESASAKEMAVDDISNRSGDRRKILVSFDGTSTIRCDTASLIALIKCKAAWEMPQTLRAGGYPFFEAWKEGSIWAYAASRSLERLRYQRRRYNFSRSHLRFFSRARGRYLHLLDACHRHQSVEGYKQDLAEVEHDLHYWDVILYLRRHVQQRYLMVGLPEMLDLTHGNKVPWVGTIQTYHFEWSTVRLCLFNVTTVVMADVSVLVQNTERVFEVGSALVEMQEHCQASSWVTFGTGTSMPLLSVSQQVAADHVVTAVKLTEMALFLRVDDLYSGASTMLDSLREIGPWNITASQESPVAKSRSHTLTVAVSRFECVLDSMQLVMERLSFARTGSLTDMAHYGCTLQHLFIRFDESYFVSPIAVSMKPSGRIVVSEVVLRVTRPTWDYLCVLSSRAAELLEKVSDCWMPGTVVTVPTVHGERVSFAFLEHYHDQSSSLRKVKGLPSLFVKGCHIIFEPFNLTLTASSVLLSGSTRRGQKETHIDIKYVACTSDCVQPMCLSLTLKKGLHLYIPENLQGLKILTIPSATCSSKYRDDMRMGTEEIMLLQIKDAHFVFIQQIVYASLGTTRGLNDGVTISSFKIISSTDLTGSSSTTCPYHSSFIQLSCKLTRLVLPRIGVIPFTILGMFFSRLHAFITDEILSVDAYRLILNACTDVAIDLNTDECVIDCGWSRDRYGRLELSTSLPTARRQCDQSVQKRRGTLDAFGEPFLPVFTRSDIEPVLFKTDPSRLVLSLTIPCLSASLELAEGSAAGTAVKTVLCLSAFQIEVPLPRYDFWTDEVRATVSPPPKIVSDYVSVRLEQVDASFRIGSLTVKGVEIQWGRLTSAFPPSLTYRVKLDVNNATEVPSLSSLSTTTSSEEVYAFVDVQVDSWDARLDLSCERANYHNALELMRFVISASDSLHPFVCITQNMADQEFNLDTIGDLHFCTPAGVSCKETEKVLVIERCSFMASRKECHLVVCEDTTVIFRNCIFKHLHDDFVLLTDKTAFYILVQCSEAFDIFHDLVHPQLPEAGEVSTTSPFKFNLALRKGLFQMQLTKKVTFVVSQHQTLFNSLSSKMLNRKKLRVENIRIDCMCSGSAQMLPVCTRITVEAESSFSAEHELLLNCSLSFGEVLIPIIATAIEPLSSLLCDLHAQYSKWGIVKRSRFVAASLHQQRMEPEPFFRFERWRVVFSISLIPLQVLLPNRMPVITLTVSNVFICSTKDRQNEDGVLHARLGLHGVAAYEFSSECFKPLLTNHLVVEAQGNVGGATGLCELHMTVSPGNIDVSAEQVRLLKYLTEYTQDLAICRSTARIINETGTSFSLTMTSGSVVTVSDQQELALHKLLKPNQLAGIRRDGDTFDHVLVGKSNAALHNFAEPNTFGIGTSVCVFSSGFALHVTTAMDSQFTQRVWVRTLVLVKNETAYRLIFTSDSSSGSRIVGRGAVSCLPESLLDCRGLNLALLLADDDSCLSLKEPLWHATSALERVKLAYKEETPPQRIAIEFISQKDASSHYVTLDFELTGDGGIMIFVHLSQPLLVNQTCFPILVEFLGATSLPEHMTSLRIDPGASASVCHLNPAISHPSRVRIDANSILYESSDNLELYSAHHSDFDTSVNFVVKHCKYPLRYFFELTAGYKARPYPGRRTTACIISASNQAFVRNECEVDILILSTSTGTPVGSLPADGLRSRSEGPNLGYVPFNHGLRLKVQELFFSEEFEIIPNFAGACIQCTSKESNGASPVGHTMFFLLRPIADSEGRFFDILPPMVIVNRHPSLRLYGRHMVLRRDPTDAAGSTGFLPATSFHVDANAQREWYTIASVGYSSYFSLSFNDHVPHSFLDKADLPPNTSWRGYIEHRNSFHYVDITRKGLYDPVTMVISEPQPALLRVVNMTTVAFREVDALTTSSLSSSHPGDKELVLTRVDGSNARLCISLLGDCDCTDGLVSTSTFFSVRVRTVVGDRDRPTIVLLFDPKADIFGHKDVLVPPEEKQRLELRLEGSIFRQCLNLRDGVCTPVQLQLESLFIYVAYTGTFTVQCTAAGLSICNECDGEQIRILEPFELNLAVRDASWGLCSVNVHSFHSSVSPIHITISDWFVYQVQQFFEHCRLSPSEGSVALMHDSYRAAPLLDHAGPLRFISIDQATLSTIPVEISWDRSVVPPTDYILGDSPLSLIIPSLHHARFVLPRVQFKKLFTPSLNQLFGTIQQLFLTEILKQLPQIVGSVGFFRSDSSLIQRIGSGLTSFFSWSSKQDDKTNNDASLL